MSRPFVIHFYRLAGAGKYQFVRADNVASSNLDLLVTSMCFKYCSRSRDCCCYSCGYRRRRLICRVFVAVLFCRFYTNAPHRSCCSPVYPEKRVECFSDFFFPTFIMLTISVQCLVVHACCFTQTFKIAGVSFRKRKIIK